MSERMTLMMGALGHVFGNRRVNLLRRHDGTTSAVFAVLKHLIVGRDELVVVEGIVDKLVNHFVVVADVVVGGQTDALAFSCHDLDGATEAEGSSLFSTALSTASFT